MLKIDVAAQSYESDPVEYKDGAAFNLRPFPASKGSFDFNVTDNTLRLSGAEQCKLFKHCLTGWSGVIGHDGTPLECSDKVKQTIFDFRFKVDSFNDMVVFVLNWNQQGVAKEAAAKENLLKNSLSSPDGSAIDPGESAPAAPAK
ncbi:MAG: hypothetical protein P1P89_13825 [Desulfobacterales bacterium]|nr:hypothetical protein [Desulfobacterales bacterium]